MRIVGDLVAYVDDLRVLNFLITRRVCSYLQHLDIQDVARKRRLYERPSTGDIYMKQITKTVTKEK